LVPMISLAETLHPEARGNNHNQVRTAPRDAPMIVCRLRTRK